MNIQDLVGQSGGIGRRLAYIVASIFVLAWMLTGWPRSWAGSFLPGQKASAAGFSMQSGYYMGTGATLAISGLGFQPQLVIIKADTTAGVGAVWKSSNMAANTTAFFPATANDTSTMITLNSDGFTVSSAANVNTANVIWKWIAFAGSNCTSSGVFCVGNYTGNGASQAISSVGFQPDLVWTKGSTATTGAMWRSSSMANNVGQFFTATTQNTTGTVFTTLNATGFTVGTTNSVSGTVYQYVAFKKSTGIMNVGTYTGNATDNTNITGTGFQSDFLFVKNANASTAVAPVFNTADGNGDYTNGFADVANVNDNIQLLQSNGFQVGTASAVNGSGNTLYYAAFGGNASWSGSGTFQMANGNYTGTGSSLSVTGLGFQPDLVIIKDAAANYAVFRTTVMPGDSTAYFANAAANFTGGVTSLDNDGFTVGTSSVVNTAASTYTWEAFGNAWNPITHAGAADFEVGAYTGTGVTSNIGNNPFQPDLVAVKRSGATAGSFKTSAQSGATSSLFAATADSTTNITALNTDGFQVGTTAGVNTAGNNYWWFAFKSGANFNVGTYTGTGVAHSITTPGFQPDLLWDKRSTAVRGILQPSAIAANNTQIFANTANTTGDITNLVSNGFTVGTTTDDNASGGIYWYAAWRGRAYDQAAYRVFENTNTADVGTPLATQNTAGTLRSTSRPFRLRILVGVNNDTLYASGDNFKLQYAAMSGTCDTSFSGESYADVTTSSTMAYFDNPGVTGGAALTADANDPTDGGNGIQTQGYQEANNFTNAQSAISSGQDGEWDFALKDNGAAANTAYCFRVVKSDGTLLDSYASVPEVITSDGAFNTDIVDSGGSSVSSPSVALSTATRSLHCISTTGTLGTTNQRIRVLNNSADPMWTLSMAATSGNTALWSSGSAFYDFNDPTGSTPGCTAGADSDLYAGLLSLNFGSATITPQSGCATTGLSLGSNTNFQEGVNDNLTLGTSASTAAMGCYWDFQSIGLAQKIPAAVPPGSYSLNMTVTLVAD